MDGKSGCGDFVEFEGKELDEVEDGRGVVAQQTGPTGVWQLCRVLVLQTLE